MNKKVIVALSVLLLTILACSFSPVSNPTAQPNGNPTTQPNGNGSTRQVLFQDNFSDTSSGWDRTTNDYGTTDYDNGSYRVYVSQANAYVFANPYKNFQNDVSIEVDATKVGGVDDNAFGVICRYQDVDNFYYFYISSDGYAGIGIDNNGTKSIISAEGQLLSASAIIQGNATNKIRVDCIGSVLTLYVNGTQVSSANDSTFTGGDVGLIGKTYDTPGTDILFDNLYVYKP